MACLAAAGICHAEVRTLDWDSIVAGQACAPSWTFAGLRLGNSRGTICVNPSTNVTNGTLSCNDLAGLVVTHVNGLTFSPLSIDLAEYSTFTSDSVIHFIGTKKSGETVTTSFEIDLLADGVGGINDFQTFTFPPQFIDIIRLEVPNKTWRFDNLMFSTVVPPMLPAGQRIGPGFSNATLLYSKSTNDKTLIIGSDYQFESGFNSYAISNTKFLPPEGTTFLPSTISPYYDRANQALYYKQSGSSSLSKFNAGVISTAATLQDPLDSGIAVSSISKPRAAEGRLLFMGINNHGADSYYLFQKSDGITTTLVTPETPLPIGNSFSTPYYYPNDIAINGASYAFDTSLGSSPSTWRLYASFKGGPIQYVIGETDPIVTGETYVTVQEIGKFEFSSPGDLRVKALLSNGEAWLHFTNGSASIDYYTAATVSPVNAGKQVSGELVKTPIGVTFLQASDELFREYNGHFYRVIGAGDKIGEDTIAMLQYRATRSSLPLRVIVEAVYESSPGVSKILELLVDPPVKLPPRFGGTVVHPESGDLFIPLSHLTYGREYWLQGSSNLIEWTDLWKVEEVVPLQHIVIPPERLFSPSFFRVEER